MHTQPSLDAISDVEIPAAAQPQAVTDGERAFLARFCRLDEAAKKEFFATVEKLAAAGHPTKPC